MKTLIIKEIKENLLSDKNLQQQISGFVKGNNDLEVGNLSEAVLFLRGEYLKNGNTEDILVKTEDQEFVFNRKNSHHFGTWDNRYEDALVNIIYGEVENVSSHPIKKLIITEDNEDSYTSNGLQKKLEEFVLNNEKELKVSNQKAETLFRGLLVENKLGIDNCLIETTEGIFKLTNDYRVEKENLFKEDYINNEMTNILMYQ